MRLNLENNKVEKRKTTKLKKRKKNKVLSVGGSREKERGTLMSKRSFMM